MSLPLTPFERWQEGTTQPRLPVNDNSLRIEIAMTNGIANDVTAQPGSPDDGDWYIIPAGATGTQWATFAEDSIAIFYDGTWYEFVPAQGNRVMVDGVFCIFDESNGWEAVTIPATSAAEDVTYDNTTSGLTASDVQAAIDEIVAGGGGGPTSYSIVTEAGASTATVGTNDGLFRYNRCGGDVTFDNAEAYTAGMTFNIRATAAIELIEDGVTLTPPAGGTLELTAGMAVQVVMTSATSGDVIGQTVAA